jgi:hypothetical protein
LGFTTAFGVTAAGAGAAAGDRVPDDAAAGAPDAFWACRIATYSWTTRSRSASGKLAVGFQSNFFVITFIIFLFDTEVSPLRRFTSLSSTGKSVIGHTGPSALRLAGILSASSSLARNTADPSLALSLFRWTAIYSPMVGRRTTGRIPNLNFL